MAGHLNNSSFVWNPSRSSPSFIGGVRGVRGQGSSQQNHQNSSISQVDHGQTSSVIFPRRNLEDEVDSLNLKLTSMAKTIAAMGDHLNRVHARLGLALIDFNASDIDSQMENVRSRLASTTSAVDATESPQQAPIGESASVLNPDNKATTKKLDEDTEEWPPLGDSKNAPVEAQVSPADKMYNLEDVLRPITETVRQDPSAHLPQTEEVAKMGSAANADMLQEKTSMAGQKAFYSDIAKIGSDSPGQPKRSTPVQSAVRALPTTPIQQAKGVITNSKPGNNKPSDPSTTKQVVPSGGAAKQDSIKKKPHQESSLADDYTVPNSRKLAMSRPPSNLEKALAKIGSENTMEHLITFAKTPEPTASPSQQENVTPLKRANEKQKGSSSSKKARSATKSAARKQKDLFDETDFQAQQDEVTKFDKGIREVIGKYAAFMADNSKEVRFTTPDGSQTLLNEILSSTLPMSSEFITPFALTCFGSRLASYSSKSDLESQKMRALLKVIRENESSPIIKQDFNFLFGIKRTRDEHMDMESRYRTMLEKFDEWRPKDKKKQAETLIQKYSDLMGLSRMWNRAYKSDRTTSNTFYNSLIEFIEERRHLFNRQAIDDAYVNLHKRIDHYRNSDEPGSDNGVAFCTALSEFQSDVVLEDIVYIFNQLRAEETQAEIEAKYARMVLSFDSWNTFTVDSGPITMDEVKTNPVMIPEPMMVGFLVHIDGQFIIRHNLDTNSQNREKVMTPKEKVVLEGYRLHHLQSRNFNLADCRDFLATRVELLRADSTPRHRLYERLYDFLAHVDSSIVIFDVYFFKACIEGTYSAEEFGLVDDEDFLDLLFHLTAVN